jgi:hypothetical protein
LLAARLPFPSDRQFLRQPNQGIWQAALNSLIAAIIVLALVAIGIVLPSAGPPWLPAPELRPYVPFLLGIALGLTVAFFGGFAVLQHVLLRCQLRWLNVAPLNYPRFLQYGVRLALLQRIGGGYFFTHEIVRDYLARSYWGAQDPAGDTSAGFDQNPHGVASPAGDRVTGGLGVTAPPPDPSE